MRTISIITNIIAILWYYLNICAYHLISVTVLNLLPQPVLLPVAMHLFRVLKWWEEYWVEYYLTNGEDYLENVRRIKNNPVCMKTTLGAYEYVCGHPEEFDLPVEI